MNKLNKGFTLIELIVVIGVLAILVGAATLSFQGVQRNARRSNRRVAAAQLADLINIYNAEAIMAGIDQIDEDTFAQLGNDFPATPGVVLADEAEPGPAGPGSVGIRPIGDGYAIVLVDGSGADHAIIFNTLAEANIVLGNRTGEGPAEGPAEGSAEGSAEGPAEDAEDAEDADDAPGSTTIGNADLARALVRIETDTILGTIAMPYEARIATTP